MEWRPKRWAAILLSLPFPALGMLYVQRPRLALVYLLASILFQLSAVVAVVPLGGPAKAALALAALAVSVVAAIHAARIANAATPTTQRRWYSRWHGLIAAYALFAGIGILLRSFCFEPFNVPSSSMHPTLPEGSFVIVKKWGYGDYGSLGVRLLDSEPTVPVARGEILLFRLTDDSETIYVKRVVGLPGDRIQCSEERIVINGAPVPSTPLSSGGPYHFVRETLDGVSFTVAHLAARPAPDCDLVVPQGSYFMLGDSRENARDSRYLGPIPGGNLVGRVVLTLRSNDPG